MAQRRMFSLTIVDTDAFLDMPQSSQLLYFHLAMRGDDDGFVSNPKKTARTIGAGDDDFKVLLAKRFLISFDSGVVVIKHWRIHNYIQKDRYNQTKYTEELSQLLVKDNGSYTECIQSVSILDTQVRLGKVRLGKVRGEAKPPVTKLSFGEFKKVNLSQEEFDKLNADLGENPTTTLIIELDQYIAGRKGGDPYKDHYAVIKAWYRKKLQEHASKFQPGKPKMI